MKHIISSISLSLFLCSALSGCGSDGSSSGGTPPSPPSPPSPAPNGQATQLSYQIGTSSLSSPIYEKPTTLTTTHFTTPAAAQTVYCIYANGTLNSTASYTQSDNTNFHLTPISAQNQDAQCPASSTPGMKLAKAYQLIFSPQSFSNPAESGMGHGFSDTISFNMPRANTTPITTNNYTIYANVPSDFFIDSSELTKTIHTANPDAVMLKVDNYFKDKQGMTEIYNPSILALGNQCAKVGSSSVKKICTNDFQLEHPEYTTTNPTPHFANNTLDTAQIIQSNELQTIAANAPKVNIFIDRFFVITTDQGHIYFHASAEDKDQHLSSYHTWQAMPDVLSTDPTQVFGLNADAAPGPQGSRSVIDQFSLKRPLQNGDALSITSEDQHPLATDFSFASMTWGHDNITDPQSTVMQNTPLKTHFFSTSDGSDSITDSNQSWRFYLPYPNNMPSNIDLASPRLSSVLITGQKHPVSLSLWQNTDTSGATYNPLLSVNNSKAKTALPNPQSPTTALTPHPLNNITIPEGSPQHTQLLAGDAVTTAIGDTIYPLLITAPQVASNSSFSFYTGSIQLPKEGSNKITYNSFKSTTTPLKTAAPIIKFTQRSYDNTGEDTSTDQLMAISTDGKTLTTYGVQYTGAAPEIKKTPYLIDTSGPSSANLASFLKLTTTTTKTIFPQHQTLQFTCNEADHTAPNKQQSADNMGQQCYLATYKDNTIYVQLLDLCQANQKCNYSQQSSTNFRLVGTTQSIRLPTDFTANFAAMDGDTATMIVAGHNSKSSKSSKSSKQTIYSIPATLNYPDLSNNKFFGSPQDISSDISPKLAAHEQISSLDTV